MNKHRLTLLGGGSEGLRISATVLGEAVGALLDGARLATRFVVEGESARKGPRPAWLDAACDFDITGLSAGSAVLELEAPTLEESDPARFGKESQLSLFTGTDERLGERTAIDLFGQVLSALIEGPRDQVAADRPLLEGCARFVQVSGAGFEGLSLDGLSGRSRPLMLRPSEAAGIERLRDETPPPQAVRVAGVLDTVSVSRTDVVIRLAKGIRVPGRLHEHDVEALRSYLGKEVVVSGLAHFRPSGQLSIVHVEALQPARPEDRIFRSVPVAPKRRWVQEPMGSADSEGVSGFFGTWPGEETEADLFEALKGIG